MSGPSSSVEERAARRVGAVLRGKYTLDRVLGVGGMAAVYLGVHRNGHRVAVKMLHPELSIDDDVRARFLREGYVANSIGHAGAVRVLDDDVADDGAAFLVMELLEGETLEQRRKRRGGTLPLREVLAFGHQLLDVLAAAHDKGVVHRDIKPDNLFVTRDRELKVLDFGIARVRDAQGGSGTWTGSRLGTPAFMPPEQALGRTAEIDARSDVWAAGATLFTLLSGRLVHEAPTAAEIVVRAATRPAPSLATVAPEVAAEAVAIVDRALAFARDDRWPSAGAMRDAIAQAYASIHGEPIGPSAIDDGAGEPSRGAPVKAALHADRSAHRASASAPTLPAEPAEAENQPPPAPAPKPIEPPAPRPRALASIVAVVALGAAALLATRGARHAEPAAARASASAAPPARCTDSRACVTAAGGKPAICRKDDGVCVALESADCHLLAEPSDIGNDATIWIGAMFPTSGADAPPYGPGSIRAVDLARRDFVGSVGGLPPARPSGPKRPIAVVACDDRADAARAAAHLAHDVRVPAVIGFARSKEVLDLAASPFGPRGVLTLACNTASMLRDIPRVPGQPRLAWRVTTSANQSTTPTAAIMAEVLEPALRKAPGLLRTDEPLRVALVRVDNPSGVSFASAFAEELRFNGKSVPENRDAFRQILVPDDLEKAADAAQIRRIADEIAAFAPHVVIDVGGISPELVRSLEERWPPGARARPRYLLNALDDAGITELVRDRPEARTRIFGVDTVSSTPAASRYALRYNEVFSPKITSASAVSAPYDAFYLFAYAAAALGEQPITGPALARALPRLMPPGDPVEVGPAGIYASLAALSNGRNIDLQGTITTLDFDLETGDATADFALYCLSPPRGGKPAEAVESGLVYAAKTRRLHGSMNCP